MRMCAHGTTMRMRIFSMVLVWLSMVFELIIHKLQYYLMWLIALIRLKLSPSCYWRRFGHFTRHRCYEDNDWWILSRLLNNPCSRERDQRTEGFVVRKIASWQRHATVLLLAICEGNPPVTDGFPSQKPVTQSLALPFLISFDKPGKDCVCVCSILWWYKTGVVSVRAKIHQRKIWEIFLKTLWNILQASTCPILCCQRGTWECEIIFFVCGSAAWRGVSR